MTTHPMTNLPQSSPEPPDEHHSHLSGHQNLVWALVMTLGYGGVEALAGWWSGSLALLGDAGHMGGDAAALGLAVFAAWVARRPSSLAHSYGMGRAEVVAALLNGLTLLAVVVAIVVGAVERLRAPVPVQGTTVLVVAALGLAVNLITAWLLGHAEQTLNTRAALLHVLGDLLGSVAALTAGAVIQFTGWTPIDPIASLLVCALILGSALRILTEALHVIMEGVPRHLNLEEVGLTMAAQLGVESVHDLHIWTLSSGHIALSAHLVIPNLHHWETLLEKEKKLLADRFDITHVTLQPETSRATPQRLPVQGLFGRRSLESEDLEHRLPTIGRK
ncbi:Zinc transporter ZitB [Gammaproteobacteria bacterium]